MRDVNRCIRAVGLEGLSPPIFYQCPVALRFEIGDPALGPYDGGRLSAVYAAGALLRAKTLFEALPGRFDRLVWDTYPQEGQAARQLRAFRRRAGAPAPQEEVFQILQGEEAVQKVTYCWDLVCQPIQWEVLLGEIIAADLGGFAPLASSVYFLNTRENILYHLYDDRGLDIAAEKRESLLPLYRQFSAWLLPYDWGRMEETFGTR